MRSARLQRGHFEPREGFDPHEFRDARTARIWYSPAGRPLGGREGRARRSTDGSALAEGPVGSAEWLVGEILSFRGEAVVLEPPELRKRRSPSAPQAAQRSSACTRVRALGLSRLSTGSSSVKVAPWSGADDDLERAAVRPRRSSAR